VVIAVGEHTLGKVPEMLIRAACPFGGGLGGTKEELCGVLSGGTLILGAMRGRSSSEEKDEALYALIRQFRERFIARMGTTQCKVIYNALPDVRKRCAPVVKEGTRILVELMRENP
jgi:C_GCAxxG_C_C family probable redox protein